jgi:2-polyprenyl-3-methyl-5-hydroxy-6-metoxy-1,4-benzoquinol methylase
MKQTPINHGVNEDLLAIVPHDAARFVEVGCSGGGMAGAVRRLNPRAVYTGIELDADYAEAARAHCTNVIVDNIERMSDAVFDSLFPSDCWIFGDVLEHLYDPWAVLRRIRERLTAESSIVACIPNAQHWSVQARLNYGGFRYEDRGLMDRTHIRWFTRITIDELFGACGFTIVDGRGRILDEPHREAALAGIRAFAQAIGADPELAASDATPLQYVVRAMPV